nr:hypothetical protein [Mucilaginibacter sp. L294]
MEGKVVFEIITEGQTVKVSEHYINELRVFHILFPDKKKPLTITVMESLGKKCWTSIPQGRQEEAEKVGREIALYYRNKKRE